MKLHPANAPYPEAGQFPNEMHITSGYAKEASFR